MAFKMAGFSAFTKQNDDKKTTVAGQFLTKVEGGYKDRDSNKVYKDPKGFVTVNEEGRPPDHDFIYKGNTIIGIDVPKKGE